ncbi:calmodulin-like [Ornithodoros turicata]|uniref:calmodulin-like n=1 Tax=Ornithodoros turicata TaxID=34597 RepID=UPI00313A0726
MAYTREDELSEEELNKVRETFAKFDTEKKGTVSFVDVGEILRTAGRFIVDKRFKTRLKEMQPDDNERQVQFTELIEMITTHTRAVEPNDLRDAFRVFDRDGHGFITSAELRHIVTTLGERMTDEEADQLIRDADTNNEGHIDYEELIKLLTAPKSQE